MRSTDGAGMARWAALFASCVVASGAPGQNVIAQPPAVPPERAAKPIASIALANAGFESTAPGKLGAPDGWWVAQHAGPLSYAFTIDPAIKRTGERSLKVESIGDEPFGSIYQKLDAAPYRDRTLRVSGWIRTEDVRGNRMGAGVGLKLHAVRSGYAVKFAQMKKDAVRGTTDWTRYELALRIPAEADHLEVGLTMYGPGVAWLDDIAVDVIEAAAAR